MCRKDNKVGEDDGHNDAVCEDVGGVVAGNSRRKWKWIRIIVQIIVRIEDGLQFSNISNMLMSSLVSNTYRSGTILLR